MKEYNKMSIQTLITKIRSGNSLAFDELFLRYYSKIYSFALRYLKEKEEAEGVVQEVFLYIWENRSKLRDDTNIKAYFFTIAYNLIKKVFRKQAYQAKYLNDRGFDGYDVDDSTEGLIEYQSTIEEINRIIDGLTPRRKLIFKMSRFNGLTNKEIAERLDISRATVDNQISEALKYIRKSLRRVDCLNTAIIIALNVIL